MCIRDRSWVIVPARPGTMGRLGWVRSIAWHWVFSSKLNTAARAGGFIYRPTTSTSFSSKCGSLETLKESTRQGLRLWSAHTRAIASLPIPKRLANDRVVPVSYTHLRAHETVLD